MKQSNPDIEQLLHAFVDGELDQAAKSRVLAMMQDDHSIRERVSELRNAKEWIKVSFEGEYAPTRTLPGERQRPWDMPLLKVAASVLLLVSVFAAGWFGHAIQPGSGRDLAASATPDPDSRRQQTFR